MRPEGPDEEMARGCTCALFSSGASIFKDFSCRGGSRRFKSPGRSRRFPPSSGGNRDATLQTIEKLVSRHGGLETGIIAMRSISEAANKSPEQSQEFCVNRRDTIVVCRFLFGGYMYIER